MESNSHADQMLRVKALELAIDLFKYVNTNCADNKEFAHLVSYPIENAYMFYEFLTDTEDTIEGEIQ